MKLLAFAVLLAVMQAGPPAPQKAPAGASTTVKSKTTEQNTLVAQSPISVSKLPAVSVEPDWGMWIFSFLLVLVGCVQAWLLYRTWGQMERQAGVMEQQLKVMQGQLITVDAAAKQTDRLIGLTGEQIATAKRSADALVNAERAWVHVIITKITNERTMPDKIGFVWVWPDFVNHGRTPAHITKIVVRPHQIPKNEGLPPEVPQVCQLNPNTSHLRA
jgi:hypothetical protein